MIVMLGQKKCPFRHYYNSSSANRRNFAKSALWDEVHVCLTVVQKDPLILVFIFIYSLISTFIHLSLWGSFVCLVHSGEAGLCSGAGVLLQESSWSTFLAPPKFYLAPPPLPPLLGGKVLAACLATVANRCSGGGKEHSSGRHDLPLRQTHRLPLVVRS